MGKMRFLSAIVYLMKFHQPDRQLKNFIQSILVEVDIQINGDRPWDMQVHLPTPNSIRKPQIDNRLRGQT